LKQLGVLSHDIHASFGVKDDCFGALLMVAVAFTNLYDRTQSIIRSVNGSVFESLDPVDWLSVRKNDTLAFHPDKSEHNYCVVLSTKGRHGFGRFKV
jgi:hypothetical protein